MEARSGHGHDERETVDSLDVAIVDDIRSARDALVVALRGLGFRVHIPDDITIWLNELPAPPVVVPVVVLRLSAQYPFASESVQAIRQYRPGGIVIGLSSAIDDAIYTSALSAGAAAVLGPDASSADVAMAIREAVDGHSVLPTEVAIRMAVKTVPHSVGEFTKTELDWLAALALGTSADKVADEAGYSPRHFRRILKSLYGRLAATSMREALVNAAKAGLLEPD